MCMKPPNSRLEVAEQWSRKHDTQLNEMANKKGDFSHTHTLSGIGGSGVAQGRSTVKWVKALFLFKATLSASISLFLSFIDQVFNPVCICVNDCMSAGLFFPFSCSEYKSYSTPIHIFPVYISLDIHLVRR